MLSSEFKAELCERLIPFWSKLRDDENGGFYGLVNGNLAIDKTADKGVILHCRILWFFSSAYIAVGGEENLKNAKHALSFLVNNCVDRENGGVFWLMDYRGKPVDTMKHVYCQSFYIYALTAYYKATDDKNALKLAVKAFELVEEKCADSIAYGEAFDKNWKLIKNETLSENGLLAEKTMNTVIHLIEAYTELFRETGDKRVSERLTYLLELSRDKIFDAENNQLLVFFNKNMEVIGDIHSYGHDIEASWLFDRALEVLDDEKLRADFSVINRKIADKIACVAFDGQALNNERDNSLINTWRIWWVQAEAVVGFVNAWQHFGDEKYLDIAEKIWDYIKRNIIDSRENGEWYSKVDYRGRSFPIESIVDPWKCPYHNGRMCIEIMNRLKNQGES